MIQVAIIVLNWNQPKLTIDTIESLLKITHHNFTYRIFLVDNGSTDNSQVEFNQKFKDNPLIKLLETKSNLGFVGGNNFGLKEAQKDCFDYFLVINNDVITKPDFLEILISSSTDKIGISGPKIYFAPGKEYHHERYNKSQLGKIIWASGGRIDWNNIIGSNIGVDEYDNGQYDNLGKNIDYISGCCMLIKRNVLDKIGLFDDRYFMYMEDDDFCHRAKLAGFSLLLEPKSIIWHINAGSSSIGGPLHDYFLSRNRLLFGFKFAAPRTKFALFRESIGKLILGRKWQKRAIIDFYRGKLGKGSWK